MKLRKYLLFLCLIGTAVFGQTILVNTFTFVLGYQTQGRVVDLYAPITSSDTTVSDQSGNGLDATLLSGRYVTLDASADTITYATDYASALRTATVMMRVTSTGNRTITSGSGTFTFTPTATGVWELLTAPAVTVAGDLSWTAGSDCDISDLRIYEGGVEVDRWIHAELETGDPDGLPVANSIRPLATGTYTGGSFSSGEPTILQTAGMDWNKYSWFNGVDNFIGLGAGDPLGFNGVGKIEVSATIYFSELPSGTEDIFYQYINANSVGFSLDLQASGAIRASGRSVTADSFENLISSTSLSAGLNTVSAYLDYANDEIGISLNGGAYETAVATFANATFTYEGSVNNTRIGNSQVADRFFTGIIHDVAVYKDGLAGNAYTGLGNDPWEDITDSVNGTESGTFNRLLTPVSDTDPTLDALGNALTFQRTPKTLNLTDGASAQIAAPVPDTIKTVANWIWHDGRAKTHIDGGNWTVGSTGTALTSTGFTGAAYFVNGESGTTLSAGWNHVLVSSTAALTTADIDFTNVQAHFLAYITTEGADTALRNYNATKSDYGL